MCFRMMYPSRSRGGGPKVLRALGAKSTSGEDIFFLSGSYQVLVGVAF